MKVYRYMSRREFTKLLSGETLVNQSQFENCRTSSEGFCFLGEESNGYDPIDAFDFLKGIVSEEILVELETSPENVCESVGVYNNPNPMDWYDEYMVVAEYCTQSYNRELFIPRRYCIPCTSFMFYERPEWKEVTQ